MDAFLPYFAGFFDGEGSIGIYKNGSRHRGRTLKVQITQNMAPCSTALLRECQVRWGGCMSPMNRKASRQAWNRRASAGRGFRVLRDIRPRLRLKAGEADIALAFWEGRGFAQRGMDGRYLPLKGD